MDPKRDALQELIKKYQGEEPESIEVQQTTIEIPDEELEALQKMGEGQQGTPMEQMPELLKYLLEQ